MAVRIHHTQVKQAAKFGVTLATDDFGVVATKGDKSASGASAGLALAALLKLLGVTTAEVVGSIKAAKPAKAKAKKRKAKKAKRAASEDGDEDGEDEEGDEDEGKSVVKRKYRTAYKPHKMTCGDALAKQIRAEFMTKRDPDTKKLRLDWTKFKQFAKNNGCWSEEYANLNAGMRRMNIVNRLRAKIEKDHKVVWSV